MGAETETVSVMEVKYFGASKPSCDLLRPPDLVSIDLTPSQLNRNGKSVDKNSEVEVESKFVPCVRSGSFADIGPRRYMEDEHICIDDLSLHLSDDLTQPSAFYGVFDGHGGPEAAAFMKKHAMRLFFEDFKLPNTSECDDHVDESLRRAFQAADLAIADDPTIHASAGTTALTALLLGRVLVVANAGDCRAVLCRKGEAVEMSSDHRPIHAAERRRVEEAGGFVDDGYLNGVVAVSRALGDWDMKQPRGSKSPLVSEPELRRETLTEDDEFLIMACDGVWDVMSSQQAVTLARRGLRRHDDPQQCARDLLSEALRLGTFDNLTVLVVCFSPPDASTPPPQHRRLRCCSLSTDALCTLKSLLDGGR